MFHEAASYARVDPRIIHRVRSSRAFCITIFNTSGFGQSAQSSAHRGFPSAGSLSRGNKWNAVGAFRSIWKHARKSRDVENPVSSPRATIFKSVRVRLRRHALLLRVYAGSERKVRACTKIIGAENVHFPPRSRRRLRGGFPVKLTLKSDSA